MTTRRKVCVVTGSRAEYGLLEPVVAALRVEDGFELQLVVTGMHLAPEFGRTVSAIEADGHPIAERVEMLLSSDTPVGVTKSLGLGVIGFADVFDRLRPDVVVLLGDRFEILAAAQAALIANLPIAHIAGGDTTEGAFDEGIRHSITKMAHIHLVTNALAARRVVQMGEHPDRVHVVGSPGLDNLHRIPRLAREALARELDFQFRPRNLLITFHPVTLDPGASEAQLDELLAALDGLGPDVGLLFTRANADTGGRGLNARLDRWLDGRANAKTFTSLGQRRYLSLMAQVDAVVGNSSSGLYEAPSLGCPTVDIGDRQGGRLAAASVVRCAPTRAAIAAALEAAFALDCRRVVNPYGDGHSAARIVAVLRDEVGRPDLLRKTFHMLGDGHA